MKTIFLLLILFCFISCKVRLNKTVWIHGSLNCNENADPPVQVVRYNGNTFILRQNKCIHYEAPFIYLFLGNKKALLMDTGATEDENQFPLYATVRKIIDGWEKEKKINHPIDLIVAHTHAHADHVAGDSQFKNKPRIFVLGLTVKDLVSFFNIENWPTQEGRIDLGDRVLEIIPIPGHQQASIAVYDHATKILLTGDSFYPGRLYISDWQAFKLSIQRLVDFTTTHKIAYLLGNHIEMTKMASKDYPSGTRYQPGEHILPLSVNDLLELNHALKTAGDKPTHEIHANFIIVPK